MGLGNRRTLNIAGRQIAISPVTSVQGSGTDLIRVNHDGSRDLIPADARIQLRDGKTFEDQPVVEDGS